MFFSLPLNPLRAQDFPPRPQDLPRRVQLRELCADALQCFLRQGTVWTTGAYFCA
jgi:hypothetical protein